jgi:hypothetical protein
VIHAQPMVGADSRPWKSRVDARRSGWERAGMAARETGRVRAARETGRGHANHGSGGTVKQVDALL